MIITTARHVETLAKTCTKDHIPVQEVPLYVLKRITGTLTRRGWELDICNEGTIHVYWRLMLRGTTRRVCRVVQLVPVPV